MSAVCLLLKCRFWAFSVFESRHHLSGFWRGLVVVAEGLPNLTFRSRGDDTSFASGQISNTSILSRPNCQKFPKTFGGFFRLESVCFNWKAMFLMIFSLQKASVRPLSCNCQFWQLLDNHWRSSEADHLEFHYCCYYQHRITDLLNKNDCAESSFCA